MSDKPPHKHTSHHVHLETQDEVEEKSLTHKIAIAFTGFILIVLIASFTFVTFPIGDILASKSESDLIINQVVIADNLKIVFSNLAYSKLQEHYSSNKRVEVSLCLQGEKINNTYEISDLYKPKQEQAFSHVSFEPCLQETLILLHTHPKSRCIASATDINTLRSSQSVNSDVLMVVMCEENRLSVYS